MKDGDGNKIDFDDKRFLPYMQGYKGETFTIVCDYIIIRDFDKKQLIFGKLVNSGGVGFGWDYEHIDFRNLNIGEVKNEYRKAFGVEDGIADPYLFIFTQWN